MLTIKIKTDNAANNEGGNMNTKEKIKYIKKTYKEGKIKKLNHNCYSVPSDFFLYGITPRLVNEVLK